LIFSAFPASPKLFEMTARDVITTIRQRISDAEQAGVREVPLSNLRRLIDQIEQGISADQAKTPDGTRRGNGQSKSDTGNMNKTPKANQKTGARRKSIPRLILGVVVIGVAGGSLSPQVPMSHDLTEFIVFFAIKLFLVAIGVWLVGTSFRTGKTVRVAR
jgi:hypothetical protein